MILTISVTTTSGLLLLGVASLCGGGVMGIASEGVTTAVLGWTSAVSTLAWLYGVGMEIFMAHYSEVSVNGVKIEARRLLRRLMVPLLMHAVAVLACVPAVRQDARWLISVCTVSLVGVIWQNCIRKTLV